MKTLNLYIFEKLKIDKDIKFNTDYQFYFDTDDYAQDNELPNWAYDYRKLKNGSRNRFWYAIVNFIYKNGPSKKENIIRFLKPNGSSQYSRLFSELYKSGVISKGSGSERGNWSLNDPSRWVDFSKNVWVK